jgi:hypothetical protein
MLTVKSVKLFTLLLLLSPLSALAGGSDGGHASGTNGHLLDSEVIANTISLFADKDGQSSALGKELDRIQNLLPKMLPEFADRYQEFIFPPTNKRFILVDSLPPSTPGDTVHFMGDEAIAYQRGQNIWVTRKFWENPETTLQDRVNFVNHEFLVSEKLKQGGPLSEGDKEDVVNATAGMPGYLSQEINGTPEMMASNAENLRKILEADHFLPGLTVSEFKTLGNFVDKFNPVIKKACQGRKIDYQAGNQVVKALSWLRYEQSDEAISPAMRRKYKELYEKFDKALNGKFDINSICEAEKKSEEIDGFDAALQHPEKPKQKNRKRHEATLPTGDTQSEGVKAAD